jgi:hypothetical protein
MEAVAGLPGFFAHGNGLAEEGRQSVRSNPNSITTSTEMKVNRTPMAVCSRAAEIGFSFSRSGIAYPRQGRCLRPARSPHKIANRAEPDEPEREDAARDLTAVNQTAREAIGLSLAICFVVVVGSLFAWSLVELMKLADRCMPSFIQSQLWIPR